MDVDTAAQTLIFADTARLGTQVVDQCYSLLM
jgi:hypothetical protein